MSSRCRGIHRQWLPSSRRPVNGKKPVFFIITCEIRYDLCSRHINNCNILVGRDICNVKYNCHVCNALTDDGRTSKSEKTSHGQNGHSQKAKQKKPPEVWANHVFPPDSKSLDDSFLDVAAGAGDTIPG